MTPRVVIDRVFAEPVHPFRIYPASGRTFEVRHPELVEIGRDGLTVEAASENHPDAPRSWDEVSLASIESIASLEASVSPVG